ncbi:serine/arginine repetitive matrix protein 2 [Drosophila sechellia]|uniref:serine/arginine repetitive matrix protein 2 n=1 Tax=Drosophila sechellia TaxID=7238 RepID=UPI0013DDF669|nr:serine/arginine repetitive matrix protein 2 [Drosophila sechellia]
MNTGISLNERFTQMQSKQPKQTPQGRGRSRSRSRSRRIVNSGAGNQGMSAVNSRLLKEFKRLHTVQTALKLKRRSLRTTAVSGRGQRVAGVKSLRLAPNGKPIRSNNVTRVATMRADLVASGNAARNRRSGSSMRNVPATNGGGGGLRQRLGERRPSVGGAAERVERRQRQQQQAPRGRSRSRSRSRHPQTQRVDRARSQSRGRSIGRSQSRNRDRSAQGRVPVKQRLSVKHRLGVRTGQRNNQAKIPPQRRAPSQIRGVAGGRVEKRRSAQISQKKGVSASIAGRQGRLRRRSVARNAASSGGAVNNPAPARRSRSRNRAAAVAAAAIAATAQGRANPRQRRGRSAGAARGNIIRNGKIDKNAKVKATNGGKNGPQQQVRRGRSRSRKPTGKPQRPEVKREDLDMELDQYMSTTKSEMDYLLK